VLAAGTQVQIVGDISGFPFDATANPGFCNMLPAPKPQRTYVPIPQGHQKRYCVYLPFNGI